MRIAYLISGAGGMYCGSCLRDNRLAARLIDMGRDVVLMPLYTPIRTDEQDVSQPRIHYGGINVFLQSKLGWFRKRHRLLDGMLDAPALLRTVGRFAARTKASDVAELAVAVLRGADGPNRKELERLIADLRAIQPDLVHLPMLLFAGMAGPIREELGVPVLCSLSGEDIFVDALPEPQRSQSLELIRRHARHIHAFVAPTDYYARHAAEHFGLNATRIHYVPLGIHLEDFAPSAPPAQPFTIGYFARICPEKGLAPLCDAFIALRREGRHCRLRIAGYLGAADRAYWKEVRGNLSRKGVLEHVDFAGEVDRAGKLAFFRNIHVLSVPSTYPEAKGLYILEALASAVPVVQPRHGSFPEFIEATGGGLLCRPGDAQDLAANIARLMDDDALRATMGSRGREGVRRLYTDHIMAEQTWALYERMAVKSPTESALEPA